MRFLLDERGAEVNQQDRERGWTPLHRAARMCALAAAAYTPCAAADTRMRPLRAHCRDLPYLEIFEELLRRGGDASLLTYEGWDDVRGGCGRVGVPQSVYDVATDAGLGWKPGRLRATLRALVARHASVAKARPFRYEGPSVGPNGLALTMQWASQEDPYLAAAGVSKTKQPSAFKVPPPNWVPPLGAGWPGSEGAQPLARRPWRAAGDDDESGFDRPCTEAELKAQEAETLAQAAAIFAKGGVTNEEVDDMLDR